MSGSAAEEAVFFADAAAFRAWLERNHDSAREVWVQRRRKGHPERGLLWEDAVVEALCFGWIDSTSRRIDDDVRAQRFSPRRPASVWSLVNVAHVERLTAAGRMHPAGLAAFALRTPERTGVYAFENAEELTDAEASALAVDPAAQAFWDAATPGYRRLCASWLHDAKRPQTRADRLARLVADSAAGRLIPPQRYGETPAWAARAAAAAAAAGASAAAAAAGAAARG